MNEGSMNLTNHSSAPSIAELLDGALTATDDERYWDLVHFVRGIGTREVFEAARKLLSASAPRRRELGADVLSQVGAPDLPFRAESAALLMSALASEPDPDVLASLVYGLAHNEAEEALSRILDLAAHPAPEVREAVAFALGQFSDGTAVDALLSLGSDPSGGVRDWATFSIAQLSDLDTPEICQFLLERAADANAPVRAEALIGLARRDHPEAVCLLEQQASEHMENLTFIDAMSELAMRTGDRRLRPLLQAALECTDSEHAKRDLKEVLRATRWGT